MRTNGGFTLIETLIATVVLLTGLVAVASMFASSTRRNINNRKEFTAAILAQNKIEELKDEVRAGQIVASGADYSQMELSGKVVSSQTETRFPFRRIWDIAPDDPSRVTTVVLSTDSQPSELFRVIATIRQ